MQVFNGTSYHNDTSQPVVLTLEDCRFRRQRVRLFLGKPATGDNWLEENDLCGTIGRSTGPVKVPILLANSRSLGGSAILDSCIMAVLAREGGCLHYKYKHPRFEEPVLRTTLAGLPEGYACGVDEVKKGKRKRAANFRTHKQAARWIYFMTGRRMGK